MLCLQFKQKIGPLQAQQPDPDADDDDDEDDVSVPSSTPETALPPSLPMTSTSSNTAAVPSTSGAKSKKKVRTPGDPDIVQLLLQQQERSQAAAGELHQLVIQADAGEQ